jgi:hypothetical protein
MGPAGVSRSGRNDPEGGNSPGGGDGRRRQGANCGRACAGRARPAGELPHSGGMIDDRPTAGP